LKAPHPGWIPISYLLKLTDVATLGNAPFVAIDDGTSTNKIDVYGNQLTNQVYNAGVEQFGSSAGGIANDTEFGYSLTWDTNDFSDSLNGTNVNNDLTGSVPSGLTTLRLGHIPGHQDMSSMYLKQVAYFPTRLGNADRQTVSGSSAWYNGYSNVGDLIQSYVYDGNGSRIEKRDASGPLAWEATGYAFTYN